MNQRVIMNNTIERLLSLQVRDIMTKDVLEVRASDSLDQAAAKMTAQGVSGAPVVDEMQKCIGILSATDFMRVRAGEQRQAADAQSGVLERAGEDAPFQITEPDGGRVNQYMASGVQSIREDASLLQAAREMCAAHIHRLPVVDANSELVGLVSSLDVVAAVVNVVEEIKGKHA